MPASGIGQPLRGLVVVEFAGCLAGALVGHLLAGQGATVVRIERPGRLPGKPSPDWLQEGKDRRTLDLGTPDGLGVAAALLATADVAIENMRPGAMERVGLGAMVARDANPRLVYLRLPGFASADPVWRTVPAWEGALGAACGLFTDVNLLRAFLGLPPVYTALPHASVYGAAHGALAVVLALLARRRHGGGDVIEVPLAAAGAWAMGSAAMRLRPQPCRYDTPEAPAVIARVVMPVLRAAIARFPQSLALRVERLAEVAVPPLMRSYRCADGELLYVFGVDHDRIPGQLLEALGLAAWARDMGLAARDPYRVGAASDRCNLAESTRLAPSIQRRLRTKLAAVFRELSASEWERRLNAVGVPCAVQRHTSEWMALPELAAAEITIQDDVGTRCPGPAAWVRSVASGAAASDDDVARHGEIGPRLAGTLVLDLSTMVAGPACSRTLAEYGAQAIHVESPRPHHGPRLTCWYGAEVNQGKRSVLLDITDPAGRAVLDRLIAAADVIVHNFSPAACRKLGLDDAPLHRTNPRAVIVRVGAYAGPLAGPLDDRRGYDPVLQAASGIMRRYGGDHPVHHGIASCVDYLTGCLAAWAAALGLLARAQGSQQVAVATSLAQAATLIQLPFLAGGANGAPTGQWAWGASALERIYRARDGWIFLAAPLGARKAVAAALGVTLTAAACDDRALARQLARAIRRRRLSSLAAAPRHGGVALVPIRSLPVIGAVLAEEGLPAPCSPVADGATLRFAAQPGPDGVTVRTLIPAYARARNAPLLHLAPAPKPGTDTVAVLAELGFAAETADLLRRGIAAGALHPRLLPE